MMQIQIVIRCLYLVAIQHLKRSKHCQSIFIDCHVDDLEIEKGTKPARRDKIERLKSHPIVTTPPTDVELVDKDSPLDVPAANPSKPAENILVQQSSHDDNEIADVDNQEESETQINWLHTLGFCTDEALRKTLQNTTQYYPTYADSEVREYPR